MQLEKLLNFLSKLSKNNNREWFNDNKSEFVDLKNQFETYINNLILQIKSIDNNVHSISAKECIFRIYRDVRFSKNKIPYKTHFGAYIATGGRKSPFAGYYIHIEPGNSFAGGGIYHPEPPILKELRYEIMDRTDELKKIISDSKFKKVFPAIYGEKLKTSPKGFSKDFKDIDLLRFKSYALVHSINDELIISDKLDDYLLNLYKTAMPFNSFFNKVISEIETN